MAVPGLVSPGVRKWRRNATTCALRGPHPVAAAAPLAFALAFPKLNFRSPQKMVTACTAAPISVPLAWGWRVQTPLPGGGARCFYLASVSSQDSSVLSLSTPAPPLSSLSGQLFRTRSLVRLSRSDPVCFELNSLIYYFWTLKSLTGVYLPFGAQSTLLQIKPTAVPPSRLSPLQLPSTQLPAAGHSGQRFHPQWRALGQACGRRVP